MPEGEPKLESGEPQMPKRESGISGYVSFKPEQEQSIREYFKEKFETHGDKEFVAKYEREKTEDEQRMISDILARMPAFIEKWGGTSLNDITPEHIHILDKAKIDEEAMKKLKESETGASYIATGELVFLLDSGNTLKNALHVVHELIHFNSFQSVQLTDAEKKRFDIRRIGFEVHTRKGDMAFKDINEAITVELEKRFDAEHFESIDALSEEVKRRNEIRRHAKGKSDDIAIIGRGESDSGGGSKVVLEWYTYGQERKKLDEIMEEILKKNQEEFRSKEEVFAVFAEASLSGKLLKVAKLIEETFGKGAFRKLAEETKSKKK